MSIIQSIIGSAVGTSVPPGPNWVYPPPGNLYPVTAGGLTGNLASPVSGYYEQSSLLNTINNGLYRRTYTGQAFGSDFVMDANFPNSYALVEFQGDPYVGFGHDMDVNPNFTMEWIGYFKPAQTENFVFQMDVDDYAQMWIGATAVSGFTNQNAIMQSNNGVSGSVAYPMTANKYYPVRIRFVENSGGHGCVIWSGLSGGSLAHNADSASTGQFFFDTYAATGTFNSTGLIT